MARSETMRRVKAAPPRDRLGSFTAAELSITVPLFTKAGGGAAGAKAGGGEGTVVVEAAVKGAKLAVESRRREWRRSCPW